MKTKVRPLKLLTDQPIDELDKDYLGLRPWAEMIAGAAMGTPGPFTIGIHGQWGYGKTTLLKLARKLVDEDKNRNVVTAWFNAWQFEREEHPLFPLVAAIVDEIERKAAEEKTSTEKISDGLKRVGLSLRALMRGLKFKGEVGMPLLGKVGVEFEAEKALKAEEILGNQTNPLFAEMLYHSAFKALESETRRSSGEQPKVVVFIDDLDRCHPNKAVFLLESIKLVLGQPGFIFVLAVDKGVIASYLEKRYKAQCGESEGKRGRFYMDKIIQLPINIPNHQTRFEEYVKRVVDDIKESNTDGEVVSVLTKLQNVIAVGAGTNPRSLVRLMNSFLLDCYLWPLTQGGASQGVSEEIASGLAFSRILQHELGDDCQLFVADDDLCNAVSGENGLNKLEIDLKTALQERTMGAGGVLPDHKSEISQQRLQIIRRLQRNPDIVKALREHGKVWLENADLRRRVFEFARADSEDGKVAGLPGCLEAAIRISLELKADEPILREVLKDINVLKLSGTEITDAGLAHLKGLSSLQLLFLNNTQVSDVGLAHLKGLTSLQRLYLNYTKVSDAGLEHLKGLSSLQELFLSGTQISDAGLAQLRNRGVKVYL